MATAAEPRPASLPLPGGRENAVVTLRPLLCARMKAPPVLAKRESTGRLALVRAARTPASQLEEVPVVAFLVEHPSAGHLLVDTGFHPSVAVDPSGAMGRYGGLLFKDVRMESGEAVAAQLRALEIETASVRTVVMTHLHADHASGIAEFPDATFVLDRREWEAASDGGEREGYVQRQFDHAFDFRLLDFEGPAAGSFATFGGAVDLFGDGSVRVVATPGHTPGHCSVVLRLREREALLCGDAAYLTETIEGEAMPLMVDDEHRFKRSLGEIRQFLAQTPDALVVPGHDMSAFVRLDPLY